MPLPPGTTNDLQNAQHYAITDNPVFKVKLRSMDTGLEQTNAQKKKEENKGDFTKKFKIGEIITGKEKGGNKILTGEIVKLTRESSTIIIIDQKSNKKVKLDPTTCKLKRSKNKENAYQLGFTTENYFISLEDFEIIN